VRLSDNYASWSKNKIDALSNYPMKYIVFYKLKFKWVSVFWKLVPLNHAGVSHKFDETRKFQPIE
jgi:hypothetical protein